MSDMIGNPEDRSLSERMKGKPWILRTPAVCEDKSCPHHGNYSRLTGLCYETV